MKYTVVCISGWRFANWHIIETGGCGFIHNRDTSSVSKLCGLVTGSVWCTVDSSVLRGGGSSSACVTYRSSGKYS